MGYRSFKDCRGRNVVSLSDWRRLLGCQGLLEGTSQRARSNHFEEQSHSRVSINVPSSFRWYISRLERAGIPGLRANWAFVADLHNYLAGMLGQNSDGTLTLLHHWALFPPRLGGSCWTNPSSQLLLSCRMPPS